MIILGIDPGPTTSGVVAFSTETQRVAKAWPAMPNEAVLMAIREGLFDLLACECIESLYSGAGKETVRTILFTGRIIEAAETTGKPPRLLSPKDIRMAICGTAKAKDSGVRAALVDHVGPKGTKLEPGPTFGVSDHAWRALAVAYAVAMELGLTEQTTS